jgi:hypothetical protein
MMPHRPALFEEADEAGKVGIERHPVPFTARQPASQPCF